MRVKGPHHYKVTALGSCVKWPRDNLNIHQKDKLANRILKGFFAHVFFLQRNPKSFLWNWLRVGWPVPEDPESRPTIELQSSEVWADSLPALSPEQKGLERPTSTYMRKASFLTLSSVLRVSENRKRSLRREEP